MSCFNSLVYTNGFKTHTLLFGEGTGLVWHICALESRLQTGKMPNMASTYLTWRHLIPGRVACTQCRNPHKETLAQFPVRLMGSAVPCIKAVCQVSAHAHSVLLTEI